MTVSVTQGIGVRRISHIVLNVSDLDASTRFYAAISPLRRYAPDPLWHKTPVSEGRVRLDRSPSLGFDGPVDFSWRALSDGTTGEPTRVVLLQWHTPGSVGEAYPDITSVGLVKFAFNYSDPAAKLDQFARANTGPTNLPLVRNYATVLDPDGTVVSFRYQEGVATEQLFHIHLSTYELARQLAFWESVLGLEYIASVVPTEPLQASQGPNGALVQWNSHFVTHPSDNRFFIDIGCYVYPEPHGEPHRAANAIGLAMIGLEVEDLAAAHHKLGGALEPFANSEARILGDIETWHTGEEQQRRVLHLRDPDGNLIQLVERPAPIVRRPSWP